MFEVIKNFSNEFSIIFLSLACIINSIGICLVAYNTFKIQQSYKNRRGK